MSKNTNSSANRLISPVLRGIAWHTSTITQCDDFAKCEEFDSFKVFLSNLLRYESRLFSLAGCSESMMEMQGALGLGTGSNTTEIVARPPLLTKLSAGTWSRLCGLICAYRLVDVIAMLKNCTPNESRIPRSPSETIKTNKIYGFNRLEHWPTIVTNFHMLMQKVVVPAANRFSEESNSATLRLLKLISCNEWSKSYSNIEGNFLIAAMHVACMREFPFSQDSFPDIPDRFESMVDAASTTRLSLSLQEKEDLQNLYWLTTNIAQRLSNSKDGLPYLRAPLQLSLLISPLYLLIPVQLHKKTFSRQLLLSISERLGNQKPEPILEVEKAIWRVVFSLADGRLEPTQLLRQLADDLPWVQIAAQSDEGGHWFIINDSISTSVMPRSDESMQIDEDEFSSTPAMIVPLTIDMPTFSNYKLQQGTSASDAVRQAEQTPVSQNGQGIDPSLLLNEACPTANTSAISAEEAHIDPSLLLNEACPTANTSTISAEEAQFESDKFQQPTPSMENTPLLPDEVIDSSLLLKATCPPRSGMSAFSADEAQDITVSMETSHMWRDNQVPLDDSWDCSQDTTNGHRSPVGPLALDDARSSLGPDEDVDMRDERGQHDGRQQSVTEEGEPETTLRPSALYNRLLQADVDERRGRPTEPSKQHPRSKNLPKKRKTAPQSDSESDDVHFAASLADAISFQYNAIREPETLKEFTEIEAFSFTRGDIPMKVQCDKELEAVDADGGRHKFRPESHYGDYVTRLEKFFERVESGYENGQPLHIANPDRSGFTIMSSQEFQAMTPQDVQNLFRRKNVVVTGCQHPKLQFDEAGLRTLAPLDSQISIIDYTFPALAKDQNATPATVSGLVSDILENARNPEGKILNAIDFPACFPAWDDSPKHQSYATDVVAWDYLRGKPYCGNFTNPYPTAHMRWGLAGTANTITFLHIDSDGYSTFVRAITGKKVWGILREDPKLPLSSIDFFLDENFLLDEILDNSTFGLEAIVLRPGDILFMRPGVPHFVYGPEHTICYGGHFYATSHMQATLSSLMHSFVIGTFITNITHHPSRSLLRRILLLYHVALMENRFQPADVEYSHVPDINTFDGVLDLLSACVLAILGNVLDFRTYSAPNQLDDEPMSEAQKFLMAKYDRNDIPRNERKAICYVRGVALSLIDWVRSQFVIIAPDGTVLVDLPTRFLVQMLNTVINYKSKAMRMKMKGAPHCDTAALRKQVMNVVKCDAAVENLWRNNTGITEDDFAFESKGYSVQRKAGPQNKSLEPSQLLRRGMTPFDIKFRQGQANGFDMAGNSAAKAEEIRSKRVLLSLIVLQMEKILPGQVEELKLFLEVLPFQQASAVYPFTGYVLNLNVTTKVHRDPNDKEICLVIAITDTEDCEGGEL